jgi:hypothetical protein
MLELGAVSQHICPHVVSQSKTIRQFGKKEFYVNLQSSLNFQVVLHNASAGIVSWKPEVPTLLTVQ